MPRSYDADLCRLRGWTPGDVLEFSGSNDYAGECLECYLLTAVGWHSILVRRLVWESTATHYTGLIKPASGKEENHSGSLHRQAIRKVGRCDDWLSSDSGKSPEHVFTDSELMSRLARRV